MTQAYLDPRNYTFIGGFTIPSGRELIIPESLVLSQTMLVKWQIRNLAKGVTIDLIPPALLSTSLEIPGLGVLEGDDYQIVASQTGRDKVQIFTLDPTLPHKLLFHEISDLVTNSILEIYSSTLTMATLSNSTQPLDLNPIVEAIENGAAAQVAATQSAAVDSTEKVKRLEELTYTTTAWDGIPANHIAVEPDDDRIGVSIFNSSPARQLIVDLFLYIDDKTSVPQENATIPPMGIYTLDNREANLGVLLYNSAGTPSAEAKIDLYYATVASAVNA